MKHARNRIPSWALALSLVALPAFPRSSPQESAGTHEKDHFVWKSMGGGFIGVEILELTPELRTHFGVPEDRGVLVSRVEEGSPASAAGIAVGDILTSADGKAISSLRSLMRALRAKKKGDALPLELNRDGSTVNLVVTVEQRERPVIDLAGIPMPRIEGLPGQGVFIAGPGGELDEKAVQAFEKAMRELEDRFDTKEWQDKLKRLRELDLDKIQERMKEVEERLRKLEGEVGQEDKKKLDR